MARFKVAIFKHLGIDNERQPWSNLYYVEAASSLAALDVGEDIAELEHDVYKDYVFFDKMTAIEDVETPGPGSSRVLTLGGQVAGDVTLRLPKFNTVRVVLSDGNGRPSQKYLRLPLQEDDIVDGTLNTTVFNLINLSYAGPLIAIDGVVSNSGDPFTDASVVAAIQMRQTSWHRRVRPGFHRGYVPD